MSVGIKSLIRESVLGPLIVSLSGQLNKAGASEREPSLPGLFFCIAFADGFRRLFHVEDWF